MSFDGLSFRDQQLASNGNRFVFEPPDQGLCAHHGSVLEAVNLAVRAYTETGAPLSPTISLNQFFGLPPEASTSGDKTTFGPFLSDPRCYYDAQTARWFMTVLEINVNPCITPDAGFAAAAEEAGMPYDQLIEEIVRVAL